MNKTITAIFITIIFKLGSGEPILIINI